MHELKSLIEKTQEKVFNFCYFLVGETSGSSQITFSCYKTLIQKYKKYLSQKRGDHSAVDINTLLFQIAWKKTKNYLSEHAKEPYLFSSRDYRVLKRMESDLLQIFFANPPSISKENLEYLIYRLQTLDLDYRVVIVLKDILKMPDELVAQIVQLRWGVFRHRLNHARIELLKSLKGEAGFSLTPEVKGKGKTLDI